MDYINKDCFAYNKFSMECEALDKVYCMHKKCRFYKTRKQNNYEELKARKNIKNKFWKDMYL